MIYKKWFDKIKELKKELDIEEDFSSREKEIIFEIGVQRIIEEGKLKKDKKVGVPNLEEKNNKIDLPESFASLSNKAKLNQHNDYVLFAIYHLVIQEGYDGATVKNVVEEYKKAYLKPSNTNVYLANLSRRGLLMPTEKKEGKAAFTITKTGINYVEELLSQDGN